MAPNTIILDKLSPLFFLAGLSEIGPSEVENDLCLKGRPQLGHEGAESETSLSQSGHLIKAMQNSIFGRDASSRLIL